MPTQQQMPGQPQIGVVDQPPSGAAEGPPQMNAQAAALYQQGMAAWQALELSNALTLFTQATQADPKAYQAFYSLGSVQERLNNPSALNSYQQAFTVQPSYDRAMVAYALLQARKNNVAEAERFLKEKRGQLPKSAMLASGLAEVASIKGDSAGAQSLAQESLKLDPSFTPAMMVIARDHYRQRKLDLALFALEAILDGLDSDNPARDKYNAEAHLLRGVIRAEQGLRGGALESFREAVKHRPDLVTARLKLATYLLEAGSAEEALPILQGTVKLDGENLAAHLSLGDAHRLLGQFDAALREFKWVAGRDESLPQVHYNLGLLYLFAPSVPGMTPKQQVDAASASLTKFKQLRRKTDPNDHDELLQRATLKKAEIEALEQANNPQPPPAAPPPADGG